MKTLIPWGGITYLQEELEENSQTTIYDDFKFVTRKDLERLNLTNLLGTNLLRAYMHGFFIDHRLYAKVCMWTSFLLNIRIATSNASR